MPSQRVLRILSQLGTGTEGSSGPERLCDVASDVIGTSGAGIMLISANAPSGTICASNDVSVTIEELQLTLGEGPCLDACRHVHPVLEPDLAAPDFVRWPAFTPPAVAAGVRAVFGFPLQVGAVCIGALNLYTSEPGGLGPDQHADAIVMAGVAARSVLTMQSEALSGTLAPGIEVGSNIRFVVHQASGMVAVQLGIPLGEALVRLRAYAFAANRPVTDVARSVVARHLRFDEAPKGDAAEGGEDNGRG